MSHEPTFGIRVGPLGFRIASTLPSLRDTVTRLYADYPRLDDRDFADFQVCVSPCRGARFAPEVVFSESGRRPFQPMDRQQAFPLLEWGMNWCVATTMNCWLILHAAVLARGESAVILPGRPGAGKSTLAAVLMMRGWRLLSDEHAVIDLATGRLVGVPRPVSLKNASIERIARLFPGAVFGPTVHNTHKGTIAHLKPTEASVLGAQQSSYARWIVQPTFSPDGTEAELFEIGQGETLIRLAENAFNYSLHGARGFDRLADLVATVRSFELPYSSVVKAAEQIETLVE